jgi:hypothetical protein
MVAWPLLDLLKRFERNPGTCPGCNISPADLRAERARREWERRERS